MYRILTASKDTYITNKIINNKYRATDANVGYGGTLDLFKLFDESTLSGTSQPVELSRVLIKFDLNPLRRLTGSSLDIADSTFKCTLKLHDVYGGQTTPSNFKLIVFPISRSFDEGVGMDVISFADLDACNWITSSISGDSALAWFHTGASNQGLLGDDNLDIISSGNLGDGNGVSNLWKSQLFSDGTENLSIDVTTLVSATLAGQIPDQGFRISYSGSQETNNRTYFVKRFGSRHTNDPNIRPKLLVSYDDSIIDHHRSFFFNLTGSLFLNNYHRSDSSNILSGSAATQISGSNSLILKLMSGSYTGSFSGSQHKIGNNFITGVYSSTFAISEFVSSLRTEIVNAASCTFKEVWGSSDGTVGYLTSSVIINQVQRSSFSNVTQRLYVNITNIKNSYKLTDMTRLRVFVEELGLPVKAVKIPISMPSKIFTKMYYQVRDSQSDKVIIPFETQSNGTRLSTDTDGMYFDFYMTNLSVGRTYAFDFLITDMGINQVFTNVPARFKVIK